MLQESSVALEGGLIARTRPAPCHLDLVGIKGDAVFLRQLILQELSSHSKHRRGAGVGGSRGSKVPRSWVGERPLGLGPFSPCPTVMTQLEIPRQNYKLLMNCHYSCYFFR